MDWMICCQPLFLLTTSWQRNNQANSRLETSQRVLMKKGEGVYNAVVIGAGTAGLVTAAGTAGLGGRVALIERNLMGGDCLNFGCVPSKALISSARLIQQIRESEKWGLDRQEPKFVFEKVFERMRTRRARIAPNDSQERFESLGVDVFRGEARFISPHEIEMDISPSPHSSPPGRGGPEPQHQRQRLRAKNFVIATGSHATIPKIEGIDTVPYFTNETIFDELKEKPGSMIVLGGGPIGCELAQTFCRLGTQVTIVQRGHQLLPREDRDVAEFLERRLINEGVRIIKDTNVRAVATTDAGKIALEFLDRKSGQLAERSFFADVLLVAIGRSPNLQSLDLKSAGVDVNELSVRITDYLQTSQRHIYAVGDVIGPYLFTHMADAQARVVVRNILMPFQFLRQKMDYSVVPWCTYTDPEVAHVGLGEKEAQRKHIEYDLFVVLLEDVDRAVVESEETGFAKILTVKGSDKILGATIIAPHAGDLLHEFVLAMSAKIGLAKIASVIHAYPTLAELARKAGDKYNKTRLTPRAKKIFSWLYEHARE
jgi:pyruvate/2-oxoglutarate dehydrogenase complex dihydrolipoamide dehydrogenase (E3) component